MCRRCGLPFEGDLTTPFACANCREGEFVFLYARSAIAAQGMALEVIHKYKYSQALWFEPFLADLLVRTAAPVLCLESWDMIVPVPLHPVKRAERGFNQAERLARHLARATGLPLRTGELRRVLPTRSQTTLSRAERAENMRRAFSFKDKASLAGQRVVLIDDVFTTGATTDACARILRKGGAAEVCVWTLARGLWH
jgi:ComF family protein